MLYMLQQSERCNNQYSCTHFTYIVYKSNFSYESVFRAEMSGGGSSKASGPGRGRGSKAIVSGPGRTGPAPAAAAAPGRGGAVVRIAVPAAPPLAAFADAQQPAAPAVASPASPVQGAGNEVEDANENLQNVIVSPEEITASRRDGTNAKHRLSADEFIEGFDKNAVGFCIL